MTDILLPAEPIHDVQEDLSIFETPYEEPKDGESLFTHIVNPPKNLHIWVEGMKSQEIVDISRMNGWPVTALCGYTWIPVHNPEKYDVCQECMRIAQEIMQRLGE